MQKLNPVCAEALDGAAGRCVAQGHYEVTPEHLLRERLGNDQADWAWALRGRGLEPARLRQALDRFLPHCRAGNGGRPVFAPALLELLQDAWLVASIEMGATEIRSLAVLAALLERLATSGCSAHLQVLDGLTREALLKDWAGLTAASCENPGLASAAPGLLELELRVRIKGQGPAARPPAEPPAAPLLERVPDKGFIFC